MPSYKDLFPDKWLKAEVINGYRPRVAVEAVTATDLEATIDAVFAPAQVDDSQLAISFEDDPTTDAYLLGQGDAFHRRYAPPNCVTDIARYDDYLRGWNDAWAASAGVILLR